MRIGVILLIVLLCKNITYAQTGFIKGTITDTLDYSDIRGTAYTNTQGPLYFKIDSTGEFFLDSLQPGQWNILLEKPGYEPLTQTGIIVSINKYTILDDLHLVPISERNKRRKRKG